VPWQSTSSGVQCPDEVYGNTATAKSGDACDGYIQTYATGHLESIHGAGYMNCEVCEDGSTYPGLEGTRCTGYRGDRTKAMGTVDCDNLRIRCATGNGAACRALAAHGAKAR
jgi:hypothetical protein